MNPTPAEAPADAPARRGRPRSEAVEQAIIEGVLKLLEEGTSIDALSIERVARVAGVGKAAVYRRWPGGKDELLLAVVDALQEPPVRPTGESVRDDLVTILEWYRRVGLAKRQSAVLRTMMSHVQSHPQLWEQYHDSVIKVRREMLHDVLRSGIASGELRADLDIELLGELFAGPMLTRTVLHEGKDLPEGLADQIADAVLDGVRSGR